MQPTIICAAAVPGLIYLNGRFAGEASRERPLFAPVSPFGTAYLEYRPLAGEGTLARRCVFSGGLPLADSLAEADGMYCVAWPGGALEVEFALPGHSMEWFQPEGLSCAIRREEHTVLILNGAEYPLPEGALPPRLVRSDGAAALLGDTEGGGQYLAALSENLSGVTGVLDADRIELSGHGMLTAVYSLGDRVGHGLLEQWLLNRSGLSLVSSESVWSHGAPRWPSTAEETALAAIEARLAGLDAEAEGYLSPALAAERPLDAIGDSCQLCSPMKYALPGERPCVALLTAENDHLATARPLYYRAEESGGAQGPWRIVGIQFSE